jgi:Tuberin
MIYPCFVTTDYCIFRTVRARAVEVVSQLAVKSTGSHLTDLLDILERILKRIVGDAAAGSTDSAVVLYTRQDFLPCKEAVVGMVRVFRKKFHQPPAACIKRCYYSLVNVLDQIYDNQGIVEHTG